MTESPSPQPNDVHIRVIEGPDSVAILFADYKALTEAGAGQVQEAASGMSGTSLEDPIIEVPPPTI